MQYPGTTTCVRSWLNLGSNHANHTEINPLDTIGSHTPRPPERDMSNTSTTDLIDDSTAKRQRTDDSGVVPGVPVEDTDGLRAVEKVVVENVNTTTTT
eukprot:5711892-Prymnesium_polylepis.1